MDSAGNVVGYRDYYPFGETMPERSMVSSADPRYQYISVENDTKTGYYATGLRLYDPWRGQFNEADMLAGDSTMAGWSPYQYSFDNPVRFKDPTGKWPGLPSGLLSAFTNWAYNEIYGARNSIVNSLNYTRNFSPSSSSALPAEGEGVSAVAVATTQSSMSKLGFHAVSNFSYAEGMGASAGAAGLASMLTLGGSETISSGIALGETFLTVNEDNSSGTMYWNAAGGVTLDAFSTAIEEPLGSGVFGFRTGANLYTHFVPPPPSLGFRRTGNEQQ